MARVNPLGGGPGGPGDIPRTPPDTGTGATKKTDWNAKIAADQEIYDDFKQLFVQAGLKGDIAALLVAYQAMKVADFDLQIDNLQKDLEDLQQQQEFINGLNVSVAGYAEKAGNYMKDSGKDNVKDVPFNDISSLMANDPASVTNNRANATALQQGLDIAMGIYNKYGTDRKYVGVNWNDTKDWADFTKSNPWASNVIFEAAKAKGTINHQYGSIIELDVGGAKSGIDSIISGLKSSADATEASINAGTNSTMNLQTIAAKYNYSPDQLSGLYKDNTGKYNGLTNALTNIAKGIDNAIQNATTKMQQLVARQNSFTDVASNMLKSLQSAEQLTSRNV